MKKPIKGKRMRVFITDGFESTELKGVQAFAYKSNVKKEGHGEYGSDGDTITIVSFENVTGSLDIEDQYDEELNKARAMMTGSDGTGIDFASVKPVWMWKNNYDPYDVSKTKILSSDLIKSAEFDEDYKSELNSIHTRAFQFQALRAVNFPTHAIAFETLKKGDTFNFKNNAIAYKSEDAFDNSNSNGFILSLFLNGEAKNDILESADSLGFKLNIELNENDKLSVIYLFDGTK